jgi:preprotein translocase subunit SecA
MIRDDFADLVYRSEPAKFEALIDEIEEMGEDGRPVLVGTISVEKSEVLSEMLKRRGIKHEVLNAKFHEREAGIVAQAGRSGAVTISTNMAGRGTDIVLGGNPAGLASAALQRKGINPAEASPEVYEKALDEAKAECAEDHERVVAAGGLHIIGTERHDARRIDNQLRGRSGRQGDPGSSRFYLSLEDSLMKRFASDRVAGLMGRMGLEDDVAIESRLVSKTIENAQTRVEGFNFDIRKRVVEYDDVINKQRETIYAERDKVLHNEDLTETVRAFLDDEIETLVEGHLVGEDVADWDIDGLAESVTGLGLEGVSADGLADAGSRAGIEEHLRQAADEQLERREQELGPETWAMVERVVLLRTIDSLWVEHLTELDDMRRGIGLRGYSGEDPLNAFKKEAFRLYEELRGFIRHGVASSIYRVSVVRENQPGAADGNGRSAAGDGRTAGARPLATGPAAGLPAAAARPVPAAVGGGLGSADAALAAGIARPGSVRATHGDEAAAPAASGSGPRPKIGRNDPCYCGSGRKYKKCHGR